MKPNFEALQRIADLTRSIPDKNFCYFHVDDSYTRFCAFTTALLHGYVPGFNLGFEPVCCAVDEKTGKKFPFGKAGQIGLRLSIKQFYYLFTDYLVGDVMFFNQKTVADRIEKFIKNKGKIPILI